MIYLRKRVHSSIKSVEAGRLAISMGNVDHQGAEKLNIITV